MPVKLNAPIMLALCSMLLLAYYALNYARIISPSLLHIPEPYACKVCIVGFHN